jgi:hypothetical protein
MIDRRRYPMNRLSIRILNRSQLPTGPLPLNAIYVGRQHPSGLPESPLSNRYHVSRWGRHRSIQLFQRDLNAALVNNSSREAIELRHILQLAKLHSGQVDLVCWCAPQACHAQIIRQTLLNMEETQA